MGLESERLVLTMPPSWAVGAGEDDARMHCGADPGQG